MSKYNYLDKKLKEKIINGERLCTSDLEFFFKYLVCKVNAMMSYKSEMFTNLSKEYTALVSEILFSYNINAEKREVYDHYYCLFTINKDDYLCDLCVDKYNFTRINPQKHMEYMNYIREHR